MYLIILVSILSSFVLASPSTRQQRRLQVIEPINPEESGIHSLEEAKSVCRDFGLHLANWVEHGQEEIFDSISSYMTVATSSSASLALTSKNPSLWMRFEKVEREGESPGGMLIESFYSIPALKVTFFQNYDVVIEENGKGALCWGYMEDQEAKVSTASAGVSATVEGKILNSNARTTFRVNGNGIDDMNPTDKERAEKIISSLYKTPMTNSGIDERVVEGRNVRYAQHYDNSDRNGKKRGNVRNDRKQNHKKEHGRKHR